MRVKNHEELVKYIENALKRKLTDDQILLVGIGFDIGLVEGREQEKEKSFSFKK
jgi:2-C-methyl-D-erythritol 4-phosphate cytidylyltransferase